MDTKNAVRVTQAQLRDIYQAMQLADVPYYLVRYAGGRAPDGYVCIFWCSGKLFTHYLCLKQQEKI